MMSKNQPAGGKSQTVSGSWHRIGVGLLAAIPFCVACLASGSPDEPRSMSDVREFAPLAFAQYAIDFGEVPSMPVVHAHFDFINRSDVPVEILGLKPSCNCLNPTLMGGRTTYAPGEAGRFHIQVRTANEPAGKQDYVVELDYKDTLDHVHTEALIFRVTLPVLKVTVEPSEVLFYQLSGEAGSQTIHVTDFRDRPLEVSEVVCDSPHASFEVGETIVDEEGRSTIPITINIPEGIPPMREITFINIHTTDEEFSNLQVPILIHGPLQSQEILPASSAVPAPLPAESNSAPADDDGELQP